uniref:NADH-ubiquinone oxidoreductase chain 4 n=2 Tax=Girardia TaxID=52316 RepID=A0A0C4ZJY8_9PLAT|nr:NADH dehydrogenase subunit 4 [Girardia sp. ER-2015]QWT28932.1 NADH dehydrogenase subunit 4 [Girardia tigrina]
MLGLILLVFSSLFYYDYLYLVSLFIFCLLYLVCFFNLNYLVGFLYKFSIFSLSDISYYFLLLLCLLFIVLFVVGDFSYYLFSLLVLVFFVFFQFFISVNLLYILLYFEFSFVVIYLLIVFWGSNPERLESLSYFLIYSVCGSFPLFGVVSVLVFYFSGSFCLDCLLQLLLGLCFFCFSDYFWFFYIYSFVVVFGFYFKFPIWGLHSWLPKAHVESPYYGSILLAGLMVKLGLYGVLYFYSCFLFFNISLTFLCFFISYLCFSLLFSNFSTIRQYDLKSYIAYSSIVHMGLVSISFWSGSIVSVFGCLVLAVSHGCVSSLLFLGANFFYAGSGTRSLYLNRGYLYIYSLFVFFWFICLVLNSSVPFSLGFFSDFLLFYVSVQFLFTSSFFFVFNLFFCGLYCLYLYTVTSHGCASISLGFGSFSFCSLYLVLFFLVLFNSFFCLLLMFIS